MMSLLRHGLSQSYAALRVILPRWTLPQTGLKGFFAMFSQVTAHLRSRAERLMNGRIDDLSEHYIYPLPLYLASSRVIVRAPEEAAAMLRLVRAAFLERGVVALDPKVVAIDLPRAGRFRVWVDWHELAVPVEGTRISSAIYYCKATPAGIRTEMVNYTHLSMPELNPQFAALALSA
jgi:hypothetical protein